MPSSAKELKYATVFIIPGKSEMRIRLTDNQLNTVCRTARDLKARYFVHVDDFDTVNNHPLWGVFDMRTAQKNNPTPGQWSINDPMRLFPNEDAAVVYAMTLLGRV